MISGLEKLTVLLVDDYEHMGAIIRPMLNSAGVGRTIFVNTGPQAMEALRQNAIDIAIFDFNIGDLSGSELTKSIRLAPDSPNPFLPIIMLTGHAERTRVFEARDAGVSEFVVKPVTARAVLDRLNAVVARPRPFIRTSDYFGPDRRRRQDPAHAGPWRRKDDENASASGAG